MKYINLLNDSEILSISIEQPKLENIRYEYHYPDGLVLGLFRKKVYYVTKNSPFGDRWGGKEYFQTAQEAIKDEKNLFVKEGKIWIYGSVGITLRSDTSKTFTVKFEEIPELISFLETLEGRWGVNLNSFICLTPEAESLYEHKSIKFIDTGR